MRNVLMDSFRDGSHPDLIPYITPDCRNSGSHGFLDQIIDPRPSLAVILAEHVVICALWGHARPLHGNDGRRTKLADYSLSLFPCLSIVGWEPEHYSHAAEPLVRRCPFRLCKGRDRLATCAERRAYGFN